MELLTGTMSGFFLMIFTWMVVKVSTEDVESPGNADKPIVTFDPDWRKMFYNETLTIACLGGRGNQSYTWYRQRNLLDTREQSFTISSIQLYDRANYQCQAGNSEISDPGWQQIITDLTIIRVPRLVFEGDILTLPCDSRMDMNTSDAKVKFYKDFKLLKGSSAETSLYLGKLDSSMTGKYKCSKTAYLKTDLKTSDDEQQIMITELFPTPEIRITPNPIEVGSDMTLTCVARLHPLRANTGLEFAFYRNGWHVRGFGTQNTFTIPSVSLDDSGDYACEVRTLTNSVRKMSNGTFIQVQALVRPVVAFYPNWNKILRSDRIQVSCKTGGGTSSGKYSWYKNNNLMGVKDSSFVISYADDENIGDYQCQTAAGEKSDPVHLDVFFVWLILQAPTDIHEGDRLVLRCQMWRSGSAKNTTFYKDDQMIKFLDNDLDLELLASKSLTGKYKCTRFINTGSASKVYTAEEFISVKDLFSPPEVQVSPYSTMEGADMTLTCKTTLSPRRLSETLQFAFYKNGQVIQNFDSSNQYHLLSVQPEHSGNYSCEVQNVHKTVKKMSQATPVQIQGMAEVTFSPNVGKIIDGESMTLTCKVDSNMKGDQKFYWYKNNGLLSGTQQSLTIQSASVNDSGYYQCRSGVTHLSQPIRLDVSNSDIILQAPPIIREGDDLVLGCHTRSGVDFYNVEFYKNGAFMKILGSDSNLQLGKAYQNTTGAYRCSKRRRTVTYSYDTYTADVFVSVEETFTYLQLKVSREEVREMYDIVLSCEARMSSSLSPLRGQISLQFAFYRDGTSVQPFGTSNTYMISKAQKTHSGNYTCEVKRSTSGVTKMSQPVSIDVQDLFSTPTITASSNRVMVYRMLTLVCEATLYLDSSTAELKYTFYRNGNIIRKLDKLRRYTIISVTEDISGDYSCSAQVTYGTILTKWSNATYILVEAPISDVQITSDQTTLDMLAGVNVTLKCSVAQGTAPVFTWFHNGKEIGPNCILYSVVHDGKTLLITSAQPHHSGAYWCKASNDFSFATSKSLEISVADPLSDLMLSTDREALEISSGESLTFTCSSKKAATYLWTHQGVTLTGQSDLYELRDNGRLLHIKALRDHHGGPYQCLALQKVSSTRVLKLESNTVTIAISEKTNPYLAPILIIVAIAIVVAAGLVYKYRHRIALPRFAFPNQDKIRVSLKQEEDNLLSMDNMDAIDRFSNSHH